MSEKRTMEVGDTVEGQACHACGYPTKLTAYRCAYSPVGARIGLCWLCATTYIGNAAQYPASYPNGSTLKTLGFIGNFLMEAIGPRKCEQLRKRIEDRKEAADDVELNWGMGENGG